MKTWGIYPYMLPYASLLSQVNCDVFSQVHVQVVMHEGSGCFQVVLGTESGRTQHYDVIVEDGKGEVEIHDVDKECISISIADECGMAFDHHEDYHVTYYVDGKMCEETHASFVACEKIHEVLIILEPIERVDFLLQKCTKTALREAICESSDAVFTYVLTGPNFHECITLCEENGWQRELRLCPGVYELIDENEYEGCVSMFLNGNCVNDRFVLEDHSLMIIEEQQCTSLLSVRFEEHTCPCMIDVHITSNCGCYDEWFTLCEDNQYALELEDLPTGLYSIQVKDDQFAYRINQCNISEHYALVQIDQDAQLVELMCMSCVPSSLQGNLKIRKWIKDEYGLEVKPDPDEAFAVQVCGCGKDEVYYLNASNSWSVEIGVACAGCYEIKEMCDGSYESSYRIDCGALQSDVCVELDPCHQTLVEIINTRKATAKIHMSKYICNEDGCYTRPKQSDIFYFSVRGFDYRQMVTLDCENNWQCTLEGLCPGCYEIKEHGCDDEVCYKIDNGPMCHRGRICLDEGDIAQVGIYNHKRPVKHGCILLQKWTSTNDGELVRPDMTKRYELIVESEKQMFTICLHAGNGFEMMLDELEAGCYHIKEVGCDATYWVNGECVSGESVCVDVCGDKHEVIVVNAEEPKAVLHIEAQHIDQCGNALALEDAIFVCVSSMMYHEEIELNEDNHWCFDFCDLPMGTYHIMQMDEDACQVRYIVDGVSRPYANVVLKDEDVCVILQQQSSCDSSKVQIRQFMCDHATRFVPENGSFEVRLYHRYYDTCVVLNEENGYCMTLYDLPNEQYYIEAQGSVYVNGECVEHSFQLCGDTQIDIVSECESKCRVCFEQQVLDENGCELPLDACYAYQLLSKEGDCFFELTYDNGYERCFLLPSGVYEIVSEAGDFDLCINGEQVNRCRFTMKDRPLSITIRQHVTLHHTLCVEKWIRQNGSLHHPCPQDCFDICLYDEMGNTRYATLERNNQWCAVFDGLAQGCYEIKEAMDDCYDASFIIDGKEVELGKVVIRDHDVDVMLINTCIDEQDVISFTLSKRIDGKGMPHPSDEYTFLLKGEVEETIVLNIQNRFEATCEIPKGTYRLSEVGMQGNVTYCVDGKVIDGNLIKVKEDMSVIALNENQTHYNLYLSAHVLTSDGNTVPLNVEEVVVRVEGVGVDESVTLEKRHQFEKALSLRNGRYEISAQPLEQYASVTYRIDEGSLTPHALCYIGKQPVHIEMVYLEETGGSMTISKYLHSSSCNCFSKPSGNEVYQVEVKNHETRTITLSAANHYSETLYDLRKGMYEIKELGDYDTTYFVDGVEQAIAKVWMDGEHHQVQIVNRPNVTGSITLCKQIRRSDGMLVEPDPSDVFSFLLDGPTSRMMTLDRSNQFEMSVYDLPNGLYCLREQGNNLVQYVVNGEMKQGEAAFFIQDNHYEILAINETMLSQGTITLRKQLRTSDGTLQNPSVTDSFVFHVSAPGYQNTIMLNASNSFQTTLQDLTSGTYVITEENGEVSYIIDGGFEVNYANVSVNGDQHDVLAINEVASDNLLYLSKFLRDRSGTLSKPTTGSFEVLISAPGYNERFVLDESNRWQLQVSLANGQYVVEETGDYDTTYIVDGQNEVRYANVVIENDSHEIQIINQVNRGGGSLLLTKYVKDDRGDWVRPSESDRFDIALSSDSFYQIYTLDVNNLFTETIDDLPPGVYEVSETGVSNGSVYYVVDSGSQSDQATVAIDGDAHTVRILNEKGSAQSAIQLMKYIKRNDAYVKPVTGEVFTIRISGAYNTEIILDASNNWDYTLTGLPQGTYRVEEVSGGYANVTYSLNGGNPLPICEFTIVSNNQYLVGIINEEEIRRTMQVHHTTPVKVVLS